MLHLHGVTGAVQLAPGTVIARDFRVIKPLAEGGMGAVYVAEQLSTGKPRALKVMLARFVQDARIRERFAQEARAGARIASDHVVEVVGAGVDDATGLPWMAMELLEGSTLDDALYQRDRLPFGEAAVVFAQLGHALTAAHAVGIVHRDLKPENIFLVSARRADVQVTVKILDFGIAKLVQESQMRQANTQAMGSPLWMAPEQTESGGMISPATDVWPLGLLAYLTLTGRIYWRAGNEGETGVMGFYRELTLDPLVPASHRAGEQGRAACLPPGFDSWFARCVARDATQRYQRAGEATTALQALLLAPPSGATSPQAYAPTGQQTAFPVPQPTVPQPTVPQPTVPQPTVPQPTVPQPTVPQPAVPQTAWPMPPPTALPHGGFTVAMDPRTFRGATAQPWPVYAPPPAPPRPSRGMRGSMVALSLCGLVLAGAGIATIVHNLRDETPAPAPFPERRPAATLPLAPFQLPQSPPEPLPVLVPIPSPATEPAPYVPLAPQPTPPLDNPFRMGDRWVGSYLCLQGPTRLTLEITHVDGPRVDALFVFQYPPTATSGSFTMTGTYASEPRRLPLRPVAWREQPPGYIAVGMDGRVTPDGQTYAGRMNHPSCSTFTLHRARP